MKRFIASLSVALGALGFALGVSAPAQAVVNICATATVVVNGDALLDESHCQTLPPSDG